MYNVSVLRPIRHCRPSTPAVLLNHWITDTVAVSYPFPVGDYPNLNINGLIAADNNLASADQKTNNAGDRMNFIFLYPGYGIQVWKDVGYGGDNYKYENKTNTIKTLNRQKYSKNNTKRNKRYCRINENKKYFSK